MSKNHCFYYNKILIFYFNNNILKQIFIDKREITQFFDLEKINYVLLILVTNYV